MTLSSKLKNLALATGLAATLTGCSPGIKEGTVYDKWYEPDRRWVQIIMIPRTYRIGKVTQTSFTYIPMFHHDDEDFGIRIRGYNEEKERCETNSFYVDKDTFNRLNIGNYFIAESEKIKSGEGIVRRRATDEEKKNYGVN